MSFDQLFALSKKKKKQFFLLKMVAKLNLQNIIKVKKTLFV